MFKMQKAAFAFSKEELKNLNEFVNVAADKISVNETGTLIIRNIAMCFDEYLKKIYEYVQKQIAAKNIVSAFVVERNGCAEAVSNMCFGNMLGADLSVDKDILFAPDFGSFLLECERELDFADAIRLGEVIAEPEIVVNGSEILLDDVLKNWKKPLEKVFPSVEEPENKECVEDKVYKAGSTYIAKEKNMKPRVFIPVMPGTNCEYDSIRAFQRAGAKADAFVFRNNSPLAIKESVESYRDEIRKSQIIMFPGGFSAGDEPDGSAKFFATVSSLNLDKLGKSSLANSTVSITQGFIVLEISLNFSLIKPTSNEAL